MRTRLKPIITAEHGFTVVEIITVVVLLSICLYPLGRALMRTLKESNDDQRLATSAFLATETVESVRWLAQCYTTNSRCPSGDFDGWQKTKFYNQAPPCNFPAPFDRYECEVQYVDGVGDAQRVREISVRVWYDDNDNNAWDVNETDVLLETQVAKRPPIK